MHTGVPVVSSQETRESDATGEKQVKEEKRATENLLQKPKGATDAATVAEATINMMPSRQLMPPPWPKSG